MKRCLWADELTEAARRSRFQLFILFLNPAVYSRKENAKPHRRSECAPADRSDEINAYELIAGLKREFGGPIFVISNETRYGSRAELEQAGADAVFWMPFTVGEFQSAFRRCVNFGEDESRD